MQKHHELAEFAGAGTPVDIDVTADDVLSEFELGQHQGENIIERVVDGVVGFIGVAILLTITGLVFGNATTRYALNFTVIWADELIVALIPWLAMCGMYLSIRQRQLIRIEYFLAMFSAPMRRGAELFVNIFSAASFCYLAIGGLNYLKLFGSDTTLYLDLPTSWFTSALFIGALLIVAGFVVEAARLLVKKT
jgi:TRAP-type C4-dicarboxylate transport system permease small subunit